MDEAQSDASETLSRPQRKTNLPTHLDDYNVGYQPAGDPPPKASSHCPKQPRSNSRTTSHSGVSSHSKTSRHSITSAGVYVPSELSRLQTAMLEETIKQRQYDCLWQQVEEDSLIVLETQRLQAQSREAQRMQEEALETKVALSNRLEQRHKLQQAETELEVAKLVSSMLSNSSSTTPVSADSGSPNTQQLAAQCNQTCSPQHRSPKPQQPPSQSKAVTSLPLPCPTKQHSPDDSAVSQPPPIPPQADSPGIYPAGVPFHTAPYPVSQALLSPSPNIALSAYTAAPVHSESSTSNVPPQPSAVFPRPCAVNPISSSMPDATLPGQSWLPSSNYQASTKALKSPGYVQAASSPSAVYSLYPSPELLYASAYSIPQPTLPVFESGAESDFALFKLALDNLLS
ncbi:uncharacterized protein LOC113069086, partial [Tachysurus ichikawai]